MGCGSVNNNPAANATTRDSSGSERSMTGSQNRTASQVRRLGEEVRLFSTEVMRELNPDQLPNFSLSGNVDEVQLFHPQTRQDNDTHLSSIRTSTPPPNSGFSSIYEMDAATAQPPVDSNVSRENQHYGLERSLDRVSYVKYLPPENDFVVEDVSTQQVTRFFADDSFDDSETAAVPPSEDSLQKLEPRRKSEEKKFDHNKLVRQLEKVKNTVSQMTLENGNLPAQHGNFLKTEMAILKNLVDDHGQEKFLVARGMLPRIVNAVYDGENVDASRAITARHKSNSEQGKVESYIRKYDDVTVDFDNSVDPRTKFTGNEGFNSFKMLILAALDMEISEARKLIPPPSD